jgi:hypothetical protein
MIRPADPHRSERARAGRRAGVESGARARAQSRRERFVCRHGRSRQPGPSISEASNPIAATVARRISRSFTAGRTASCSRRVNYGSRSERAEGRNARGSSPSRARISSCTDSTCAPA